jgi:hypothetical protein
MKLIDIIKTAYNGMPMTLNAIYTLTPDILEKFQFELSQCDEFKNCQLIITKLPRVQVGINKYDVTTRRINHRGEQNFILGNGIFYLYQINTADFINFDIRGYFYDLKNIMNVTVREGEQEINMTFDGEKVSEEQTNLANKVVDETNFDEVMKARTKSTFHGSSSIPDYVIDALKNINTDKIENDFSHSKKLPIDSMINKIKQEPSAGRAFNSIMEVSEAQSKMFEDFNKLQEKDSYTDLVKEINTIEKTLNDCDGLDDDQIIALKDKIKNFESKLKDKVKPKTITISSSVHNKIKKYCNDFNLKIGDWVEDTLLKALDCTDNQIKQKYSTYEEYVDASKKDLIKKWKEYQKINKLIKSDNLILKEKFKFKGFSFIDHKPMYDYLGTDAQLQKELETIKCKIYLTTNTQELSNPIYIDKFAEMPVEGFDINIPGEENSNFLDGGLFGEENPELFVKLKNMFRIK